MTASYKAAFPIEVGLKSIALRGWCSSEASLVEDPSGEHRSAVIMIHPANGTSDQWKPLWRRLPAGPLYLALNLRGHDSFERQPGPYTIEQYTLDLLEAMKGFGISREIHLIGASAGGAIAVALASELGGSVRSLTAIGSSLSGPSDGREVFARIQSSGTAGMLRHAVTASFPNGTPPDVVEEAFRTSNWRAPEDVAAGIWQGVLDCDVAQMAERLKSVPALIITGDQDATFPVSDGRRFADALDGHFVVVRASGHLPFLDRPQAVAEAIMDRGMLDSSSVPDASR